MSLTSNRLPQVGTGSLTERAASVFLEAILGTFPDDRLLQGAPTGGPGARRPTLRPGLS